MYRMKFSYEMSGVVGFAKSLVVTKVRGLHERMPGSFEAFSVVGSPDGECWHALVLTGAIVNVWESANVMKGFVRHSVG